MKMTMTMTMKPADHAWMLARNHGTRAASTAAAIRKAQARALILAAEAESAGLYGTARALRRKVAAPRPGDVLITHLCDRVRARITAYGAIAEATHYSPAPKPITPPDASM